MGVVVGIVVGVVGTVVDGFGKELKEEEVVGAKEEEEEVAVAVGVARWMPGLEKGKKGERSEK